MSDNNLPLKAPTSWVGVHSHAYSSSWTCLGHENDIVLRSNWAVGCLQIAVSSERRSLPTLRRSYAGKIDSSWALKVALQDNLDSGFPAHLIFSWTPEWQINRLLNSNQTMRVQNAPLSPGKHAPHVETSDCQFSTCSPPLAAQLRQKFGPSVDDHLLPRPGCPSNLVSSLPPS